MDTPNIMSIRELIDTAFGEPKMNVVHHKLIQTILIILARQLRLLERRVEVEIGPLAAMSSGTSISVTEVKLHANVPRKKRGKAPHPGAPATAGGGGTGAGGGTLGGTDHGAGAKGVSKAEGIKTPTSKPSAMSYEKSSSTATKTTTDKSTTGKSSSGITSSGTKSTTDKTSSDVTSSTKTKTSTEPTKSTTETTKSTKSTTETLKSTKTSTEPISSATKSSSDKMSTGKSKTTSEPFSTAEKSKSTTEPSTEKSASDNSPGIRRASSLRPVAQVYHKVLDTVEEQRERELRIIHQRTDSREERMKTPTPMASMDSMEKQYEKLLIVERVPTDGVAGSDSRTMTGKTPRLSVVTQDEFKELSAVVRQLQDKFKTAGVPGFPENAQLMDDLRKGASLTDAMAALQLSARLEAAEKALEKMMSLVTDLASRTPGIDVEELLRKSQEKADAAGELTEDTTGLGKAKVGKKKSATGSSVKEASAKPRKSMAQKDSISAISGVLKLPSETEIEAQPAKDAATEPEEPKEPPDNINYEELDNALQEIYDECLKMVTTATNKSNTNANNALKIAHKLEGKLDESLNLGDRMFDLEKLVLDYADQINTLDTGLSSQMTNYQEQLTQMQHDLESGLEAMAEALANTGGDTAAVAELNNHFTNLQTDIDIASTRQKELRDLQNALSLDLQGLWKQIEILRDTKSDRDEVADALRDKAGLGALNGLVSRQEFDAVRGDLEKRIGQAYDKFNNQEITWQKAIDDLIRELNEKADWLQVVSLQESIGQYLDKFRAKIRAMEEVVGEPRAATVSRRLFRDTECLSCSTPAHLEEWTSSPPILPSSRPAAVGAEAQPKEDGDHGGVCYPGLPVPHAVDARAHVCHRYCGGSHTLISNTLSRAPAGMIINPALRKVNTAEGTDGKLYMVDEPKKPCIQCNYKKTTTPEPSEAEPAPFQDEFVSDMASLE